MKVTLRQLQIFQAVVETGSTAAAAAAVSLTQSAASAALGELENLLGTRVFDRVGKRLVLNDNGRTLSVQARWLLDGAAQIERQFSNAPGRAAAGPLRIGASTTIGNYLMPRLLADYRAHADISQVDIRIGNTGEIVQGIARFELDAGFIEGPSHDPHLAALPWIRDELVLIAGANHPLSMRRGRVPVAALRDAVWLLREPGSGTREVVEEVLRPHLHGMKSGISFGDSEAIKRATAHGLGISCLSRWVVQDMLRHGELAELKTTLPALSRLFYIVRHPHKFISRNLEQFLSFSRREQFEGSAPASRAKTAPARRKAAS